MRTLNPQDVMVSLEVLPEDELPHGSFASGDDDADEKMIQQILDDLSSGNEWAWCIVKISVSWGGFTGTELLGGCSYKSQADFVSAGFYFKDMVQAAFDELLNEVKRAGWKVNFPLNTQREDVDNQIVELATKNLQ